jgi:hypothetical protein
MKRCRLLSYRDMMHGAQTDERAHLWSVECNIIRKIRNTYTIEVPTKSRNLRWISIGTRLFVHSEFVGLKVTWVQQVQSSGFLTLHTFVRDSIFPAHIRLFSVRSRS